MANLATKAGVEGTQQLKIHAPLMQLTKEDIIRRGLELGVDYAATLSCYDPDAAGPRLRRVRLPAGCGCEDSPRRACSTPPPTSRDAVVR